MVAETRKVLYNTVLSQVISTCGRFLFVGNNFGDVFVLSIRQIHAYDGDENMKTLQAPQEPIQKFTVKQNVPINALSFHRNFLIVGTIGRVFGYKWDNDKFLITQQSWEIKIPYITDMGEAADINCFWLDKVADQLYVGCGDNNIYQTNLESGEIVREFCSHTDFIHCLTGIESRIFSASEDGCILFWDYREKKPLDKIQPYKKKEIARPELGIWQGTVSITDDWLICGGGPKGAMFHLRSMECTNVFSFPDKIHCSGFIDDIIFLAGDFSTLQEYSFNGEITAEIPVSGPSVYSVAFQNEPLKLITLGGASNCLDVCTQYNYKDTVIKLYKP